MLPCIERAAGLFEQLDPRRQSLRGATGSAGGLARLRLQLILPIFGWHVIIALIITAMATMIVAAISAKTIYNYGVHSHSKSLSYDTHKPDYNFYDFESVGAAIGIGLLVVLSVLRILQPFLLEQGLLLRLRLRLPVHYYCY